MADKDETDDSLAPGAGAAGADIQANAAKTAAAAEDDLAGRIASLRKQLDDFRHQLEALAQDRLADARDLAGDVGSTGADVARRARQRTVVAARAVRDDPLPVLVALGVLALLTGLLVMRSRDDRRHHSWMR